jgi:hypothetical protein
LKAKRIKEKINRMKYMDMKLVKPKIPKIILVIKKKDGPQIITIKSL